MRGRQNWLTNFISILRLKTPPVISNFAVWAAWNMYPKTLAGLATAYGAALPFFRNQAFGPYLGAGPDGDGDRDPPLLVEREAGGRPGAFVDREELRTVNFPTGRMGRGADRRPLRASGIPIVTDRRGRPHRCREVPARAPNLRTEESPPSHRRSICRCELRGPAGTFGRK